MEFMEYASFLDYNNLADFWSVDVGGSTACCCVSKIFTYEVHGSGKKAYACKYAQCPPVLSPACRSIAYW
jgi:hypothetical protein